MADPENGEKKLFSVESINNVVSANPKTAESFPLATKSLAFKRILAKCLNRIEDPLLVALRQRGKFLDRSSFPLNLDRAHA